MPVKLHPVVAKFLSRQGPYVNNGGSGVATKQEVPRKVKLKQFQWQIPASEYKVTSRHICNNSHKIISINVTRSISQTIITTSQKHGHLPEGTSIAWMQSQV